MPFLFEREFDNFGSYIGLTSWYLQRSINLDVALRDSQIEHGATEQSLSINSLLQNSKFSFLSVVLQYTLRKGEQLAVDSRQVIHLAC